MNTVLVVDDSKTARLTLKRKLEALNYQVEMADSGEAALEFLQRNSAPDLIFMDVLMGSMSGYEAARLITQNPATASMPIVMCTSKDSAEDRAEATQNGAQGFIIKPISDEELGIVLKELITEKPAATAAPSPVPAPVSTPTEAPVAMPSEAFVIPPQLESLVRRWIEESNTHVAEAVAQKVVHGSLSQHLGQVEDMLEGKISILSSSLAALHSAQERAQAEYQATQRALLEAKPQDYLSVDALHDMEARINHQIAQQLQNQETQEQAHIAAQEQQQAMLEQTMFGVAEKAATTSAEKVFNNALGSHFALMDEKIHTLSHELAAVKDAAKPAQTDSTSEQMMENIAERVAQRVMEVHAEHLVHAALETQLESNPAVLISQTLMADELITEKMVTLKNELHAELMAALPESTTESVQPTIETAPLSLPDHMPEAWLREVFEQQDQHIEQRLQQWNADFDERLAQHKEQLLERVEHASAWMSDQLGTINKRQELIDESGDAHAGDYAETTHVAEKPSPTTHAIQASLANEEPMRIARMALGVAALAVVIGLIALFAGK
jgi:CheY-like chemotaxis protein